MNILTSKQKSTNTIYRRTIFPFLSPSEHWSCLDSHLQIVGKVYVYIPFFANFSQQQQLVNLWTCPQLQLQRHSMTCK